MSWAAATAVLAIVVALGQAAARPGAAGDDEMMEKGPVGDEWVRVGGLGAMYLMWVAWGQSDAAQAYADVRAGLRAAGRVLQVIEARIIVGGGFVRSWGVGASKGEGSGGACWVGLWDRGMWGQALLSIVRLPRLHWCWSRCWSRIGVGHVLVLVTYRCWSLIGVGHGFRISLE